MSVSAAELPAMSGIAGADPASIEAVPRASRRRAFAASLSSSSRPRSRFLALGDVVVGRAVSDRPVRPQPTRSTSGGFWPDRSVGLLASTLGRLYSSTYYALRDTRTPLATRDRPRGADDGARLFVRDSAAARARASPRSAGAAGLTASAGVVGLGRNASLRCDAERPDRETGLAPPRHVAQLWGSAIAAATIAWARQAGAAVAAPGRDGHPRLGASARRRSSSR